MNKQNHIEYRIKKIDFINYFILLLEKEFIKYVLTLLRSNAKIFIIFYFIQ
jgi:hypothetical protein